MFSLLLAVLAVAALPATAWATHNDVLETAELINAPGTVLGSFSTSHTTLGDPRYNPGEYTICSAGTTTTNFGSSVFYRFYPHRNGRVRVVVQATSGNLEPVVSVIVSNSTFDLGNGVCNGSTPPINRATLPADGYLVAPAFPISAGTGYLIQVGGATINNGPPPEAEEATSDPATEGGYDLTFIYDPDTDGDGIFDSEDDCDNQSGSGNPAHRGCPDSDGDNIRDPDDRCPTAAGSAFGGCPDADGDNVPEDGSDKCPGINPNRLDRNDRRPRDGCPDIRALHTEVALKKRAFFRPGGIFLQTLVVTGVPRGARVKVVCKLPNGRKCGGLLVRSAAVPAGVRAKAARRLPVKRIKRNLPFGTKITTRVTAPYATGSQITLTAVRRIAIKEVCRYNRYGSKRLIKRKCS